MSSQDFQGQNIANFRWNWTAEIIISQIQYLQLLQLSNLSRDDPRERVIV